MRSQLRCNVLSTVSRYVTFPILQDFVPDSYFSIQSQIKKEGSLGKHALSNIINIQLLITSPYTVKKTYRKGRRVGGAAWSCTADRSYRAPPKHWLCIGFITQTPACLVPVYLPPPPPHNHRNTTRPCGSWSGEGICIENAYICKGKITLV